MGRISRSWCPSSIRSILRNDRYRGLVTWGKTRKVRSPKTGKRIYRKRPESEWTRTEISERRLISEELWQRVEARRENVKVFYFDATRRGLTNTRAMNSAYLFSGLLECAECSNHQRTWSSSWHMILRKHLKSKFPVKQPSAFSTGPMSLGVDKDCTQGGASHCVRRSYQPHSLCSRLALGVNDTHYSE